jgi:two-component system, LytTR family, response regulator LytT
MKIIIIEDEKLTAKDLAKTIQAIEPEVEIMAMLASVEEAVEYLQNEPNLDLIFSDIELGDGLSFEIFEKLKIKTPIIFCTAYNQYAIEAFKSSGIDYILKPISKNSVERTLEKYQQLKERFAQPADDYSNILTVLKNQLSNPNPAVLVNQGDKIIPLNGADIALFYIEGDYTYAHTFEQKNYLVSQNLESLEKTFSATFFRANRQFLINRKAIKDASHYFNRKLLINLNLPFKEQIVVGKLKVTSFLSWLAGK